MDDNDEADENNAFWDAIEREGNQLIATQYGGNVPTPTALLADITLFARELEQDAAQN